MSLIFRKTVCAAIFSTSASIVIATSAAAQEDVSPKFTDAQKLGYLGKTSKHALTQAVLDQLAAQTEAPTLTTPADRVIFWHNALLDSIALDHTGSEEFGGLPPFFQGGPGRTSRALGMVNVAVYDAINAFGRPYAPYNKFASAKPGASMDVAIAYASYTVQKALYPWREETLMSLLESDLAQTGLTSADREYKDGKQVGENAAFAMLKSRHHDRSKNAEPGFGGGGRIADGNKTYRGGRVNDGGTAPFDWTPDPNTPEFDVLNFNVSLGAFWGGVTPFTLNSGDQFRIPPYPQAGSTEYIAAFKQVKERGRSPAQSGSTSTPATRFNGNFWGYDAVPLLGTPPRAFNQFAMGVILQELGCEDPRKIVTDPMSADYGEFPSNPAPCASGAIEIARVLAKINAGLADAGIAAWDSKYYYNYWRPVTGIRIEDGVGATDADPSWDPVGVSIINVELPPGEDFVRPTPPFPSYPSGHSTFGAVTMNILADEYGNATPYNHVSDEYNGRGVDPSGVVRPLSPVLFNTLTDAQVSNGISRIDNGVHWSYDDVEGQKLGAKIANWIINDIDAFK